jgi:ParB family chromosome partitioning protein
VLQPLVVRAANEGYQLSAGERRLRAAKAAGLVEVPVHVVNFGDQQVFEAALVENIQRSAPTSTPSRRRRGSRNTSIASD